MKNYVCTHTDAGQQEKKAFLKRDEKKYKLATDNISAQVLQLPSVLKMVWGL